MIEIRTCKDDVGQVQIADEVVAVIAGTAALEIDGVAGMASNFTDFPEILGRKNLSKGITVDMSGGSVAVAINLMVKLGYKVQDVAVEVQRRVKSAIETMTGLEAASVNINVTGVHPEKKDQKVQMDSYE